MQKLICNFPLNSTDPEWGALLRSMGPWLPNAKKMNESYMKVIF